MRFIITSKIKAANFDSQHKYAIIGVVSHNDDHPEYLNDSVKALQLKFYDVDFDSDYWPGITESDAKRILEFVEENKTSVDFFLIHCNAGISRSSGMAAALSKIYNGDDSWVFKNRQYIPNMMVYRSILEAAEKMNLY